MVLWCLIYDFIKEIHINLCTINHQTNKELSPSPLHPGRYFYLNCLHFYLAKLLLVPDRNNMKIMKLTVEIASFPD